VLWPGFRRLGLLKSAGKAKAVKHGWLWLGFGLSRGLCGPSRAGTSLEPQPASNLAVAAEFLPLSRDERKYCGSWKGKQRIDTFNRLRHVVRRTILTSFAYPG
jgi:hypothetical protein